MVKKDRGFDVRNFHTLLIRLFLVNRARDFPLRVSLWTWVIARKYVTKEGRWFSKVVRNDYGMGFWRTTIIGWEVFRNRACFIVVNGTWVKFWKDEWCGESSLEESYPELFSIILDRDSWIVDM